MTNNVLLSLLLIAMIFVPASTFSQGQQVNPLQIQYHVIKTKNSERFDLPFMASNNDRIHPTIYFYDKPKATNWILTIQNNMSYAVRKDAKTIVKLQEPAPSEKFIEIAMFGDVSKKFWAAVNTHDSGYVRIYERDIDGWSRDQPIIVAHANNQGLTITNGKRIIVDRLSINGFTIGSIAVYGKDDPISPLNTYEGDISFDVVYGDPANSPIYYLPLGMLVGVGGLVTGLLVFKKRKKISQEEQ
jgi:hypothetical protein